MKTDIAPLQIATFLAIAFVGTVAVSAQSPTLQSLTPADLDAFITRVVAEQKAIGVTVGVMQDGKVIFNKGFGLANVGRNAPVTPNTLFAIGSVTKQFTCAVALQLEQEGKLSFDDRLSRYNADFGHSNEITLRDLGNHVSGYRDYYPLDFVDRPMAKEIDEYQLLKTFSNKPLDFPPGSRYSYSNTGYLLLGHVVSLVGRKPFEQSLQERIITPLGLTMTRFEPTRGAPGLAEGYTQFGLGPSEVAVPEGRGWIGAAGGIWSTSGDLLKWDLALMDGTVVNAKSWKTMTSPRELTGGRSSAYGCGLQLRDRGPQLILVHSGGVSGFGARNAMIPATKSAVVVIANADYSGGVLDTIQEAVLAKLLPVANAPAIAGPPARDAALEMLRQIRSGTVDRSKLSDEYNAFLTPERLAAMAKSLRDAGEISDVQAGSIGERGGLEVSTLRMLAGNTPISTLMYRAPDGKIEEFLFSRR
ncbi:MAG: beta-lactamase family protein [Cyanobacteria bacterium]|nr:beta-lactamase family protein [Cyanobacteriota bacterium]